MNIPTPVQETMDKEWADIKPEFDALLAQEVTEDTIEQWLKTWTKLADRIEEASSRLAVLHTLDTADAEAERRYFRFAEDVMPEVNKVYQALNKKLVESGLIPPGMEVPLRDIRTSIEIFREQNLPLFVEHQRLGSNYSKIVAAQTVEWDGDEKTLLQMQKVLMDDDRPTREKAWQAIHNRWLEDRAAINENWVKLMDIRKQMAENAGFSDYRTYRWQQLNRHDYTPDDCYRFHEAIEKMAVPAAAKLQERHRQRLGLNILRPWDLDVDSLGDEPLRPFESIKDFEEKGNNILERVSPQFGAYFQTMRDEKLLDLDNRKGKAPGGYCTSFDVVKRPFIFMNAVGIQLNVRTLLHEAGHCFHVFETNTLPYRQQGAAVPMEFAEVASMAMELLSLPYYEEYYSPDDANRARIEQLERIILFWPYMAVVDAWQHWCYENHEAAMDPANCDAEWSRQWDRFHHGPVSWDGLEGVKETGWQRKGHPHGSPFYYIEYGLAQLGAVQVWKNSLEDNETAVRQYREALKLGGTATLPDLYKTAGAKLAFDEKTLGEAVDLLMSKIDELEKELV